MKSHVGFAVLVFWGVGLAGEPVSGQTTLKPYATKLLMVNEVEMSKRDRKGQADWFYTALAVNYVVLNIVDLGTTFSSIDKGAREANPVARLFIKNKPLAIAFKGGVTAGVLYGLAQVKRNDRTAAYVSLGLLNVMYGLVVANNVSVYLQLSR